MGGALASTGFCWARYFEIFELVQLQLPAKCNGPFQLLNFSEMVGSQVPSKYHSADQSHSHCVDRAITMPPHKHEKVIYRLFVRVLAGHHGLSPNTVKPQNQISA